MIIKEVGISPSTTYNTAYTLRAYALAHGTLLPSVATSYMLGTLAALYKTFHAEANFHLWNSTTS